MSRPLVSDDLWAVIEPLLPVEPPKPKGGRPRCDNCAALAGIIFVMRSGIPWEMLPRELGCSGMTCWRRLGDWHGAGVWADLHRVLLERLADAGHLDWSRASLDSASVAANLWPAASASGFVVVGLAVCTNVSGLLAYSLGPRWRSARSGPHKGADLEGPFCGIGFQSAGRLLGHLPFVPPADLVGPATLSPVSSAHLVTGATIAS